LSNFGQFVPIGQENPYRKKHLGKEAMGRKKNVGKCTLLFAGVSMRRIPAETGALGCPKIGAP
jgi:hypothetical protein